MRMKIRTSISLNRESITRDDIVDYLYTTNENIINCLMDTYDPDYVRALQHFLGNGGVALLDEWKNEGSLGNCFNLLENISSVVRGYSAQHKQLLKKHLLFLHRKRDNDLEELYEQKGGWLPILHHYMTESINRAA